jgi:hypothetical protein
MAQVAATFGGCRRVVAKGQAVYTIPEMRNTTGKTKIEKT